MEHFFSELSVFAGSKCFIFPSAVTSEHLFEVVKRWKDDLVTSSDQTDGSK